MKKKARYFEDYARLGRQIALAASLLSVFVTLYTLGTFIGLLHP